MVSTVLDDDDGYHLLYTCPYKPAPGIIASQALFIPSEEPYRVGDVEIEVKRSLKTCLRSHSKSVVEKGIKLSLPDPKFFFSPLNHSANQIIWYRYSNSGPPISWHT